MELRDAFEVAGKGADWVLKGRGHADRVALKPHISRVAAGVTAEGPHWVRICPGQKAGPRRMFAVELVKRAADLAGVAYSDLISK